MSDNTSIEWCDHTFNPWWGCRKVSRGCKECYAEKLAKRYGFNNWGAYGSRRLFGDKHWAQPETWNRRAEQAGVPAKVFCASMADVFEDHPALPAQRERLWDLIGRTPWLRWQLLTKRPENVNAIVPWGADWPAQVWLGISVESQRFADQRIPELRKIPARVKFLSVEPLVGPVDPSCVDAADWTICGGESGAKAAPMHPQWVRRLRDRCQAQSKPFLFKQWGKWGPLAPLDANGVYDFRRGHTMANDGTLYRPLDLVWPDGPRVSEALRRGHDRAYLTAMYPVGKKRAGRELDGRTWDEFPAEVPA